MKKYVIVFSAVLLLSDCTVLDKAKTALTTYQSAKSLFTDQTQHHTVIVAGYGTPVKGNTTYENYIKAVAVYVNNPQNAVDSVIFSGGYTTKPNLSEAEAMNTYFNTKVDVADLQQRGIHVYKEECSIVSWQNISYSQDLLTRQGITPTQVTLFGDIDRQDKLKSFAVYKFNLAAGVPNDVKEAVNRSLHAVSVDFQGFTFGNAVDNEDERNAKFAAEILGAYDTKIGNKILGERLTAWSSQYSFDVADNLVRHGCSEYSGF